MGTPHYPSDAVKSHAQETLFLEGVYLSAVDTLSIFQGLVLRHINHYRLFNAKSIFIHIKCSISNYSV